MTEFAPLLRRGRGTRGSLRKRGGGVRRRDHGRQLHAGAGRGAAGGARLEGRERRRDRRARRARCASAACTSSTACRWSSTSSAPAAITPTRSTSRRWRRSSWPRPGMPVAKHGNRAASSACGSADLLEAAGSVDRDPARTRRPRCCASAASRSCSRRTTIRRCATPQPVRRELGVRTIFNLLGPLTNPARATHQVVGVAHESLVDEHRRRTARRWARSAEPWCTGAAASTKWSAMRRRSCIRSTKSGARLWQLDPSDFGRRGALVRTPVAAPSRRAATRFAEILGGARSPRCRRRRAERRGRLPRDRREAELRDAFERARSMLSTRRGMARRSSARRRWRAWLRCGSKLCGCTAWGDVAAGDRRRRRRVRNDLRAVAAAHRDGRRRRNRRGACRPGSSPVAVFVNPSHESSVETVRALFPRALLQFSGDEPPGVRRALRRLARSRRFTSTHHGTRSRERAARFPDATLLLDSRHDGLAGGTGTTFAWEQRRADCESSGASSSPVASRPTTSRRVVETRAALRRGRAQRHRDRRDERSRQKMRAFVRAVREFAMKPDARGYFGRVRRPLRSRGVDRGARRAGARDRSEAFADPDLLERVPRGAARLRRPSLAALSLRALRRRRFGRAARDEARRYQSYRRAQDQQHRRSGAARAAHGQAPATCRNRRRSARRRDRDGRREVRPAGRRVHGRARRRAPGAQRSRDAIARRVRCTPSTAGRRRSRTRPTKRSASGRSASTTRST